MIMKKQDLIRVLKWAFACEVECQMNSADYKLAADIATAQGNPEMAGEFTQRYHTALKRENDTREYRQGFDAAALCEPLDETKPLAWCEGWHEYQKCMNRSETQRWV